MNWMPSIFRRDKLYDDLSEEIRLHIEERAEHLMHEGMSQGEAEREARLAFGNRALLEERSREVWQWPTVESIWADVRFALRQLRRSPGFTISRHSDAGVGHRRQRGGVQCDECLYPAPAECAASRRASTRCSMETRLTEASPIPTISICATATTASMG